MAKQGKSENEYGPSNVKLAMEGDDVVIRLSSKGIAHNSDGTECRAGTAKPKGGVRAADLISTTNGFAVVGSVKVSLNVTSI
jgi:hypothetical protein